MRYVKYIVFYFCFITTLISYGCKYTVREIGFSDIGLSSYYLNIITDSQTPEEEISLLKKLIYIFFREANIKLKFIDIDQDTTLQIVDFLDKYDIQSLPAAIFIFPQGESLIFSLNNRGRSFERSLLSQVETLVSSPFRESIKAELIKSFCVVLVFEGSNKFENKLVLEEVKKAVNEFEIAFDRMPKKEKYPPAIMVIPYKEVYYEDEILLMSLGIKKKENPEPSVSVIYGRGRIIGPVLHGDQISRDKIVNLLTIIGADCECGLDNSWILGSGIPLRWDMSIQSELAEYLGFNVENPIIKSEMSQILSINTVTYDINPLANGVRLVYSSEGKILVNKRFEPNPRISAYEIHESFFPINSVMNNLVMKIILIGLGGMIILVTGIFIIVKYKR